MFRVFCLLFPRLHVGFVCCCLFFFLSFSADANAPKDFAPSFMVKARASCRVHAFEFVFGLKYGHNKKWSLQKQATKKKKKKEENTHAYTHSSKWSSASSRVRSREQMIGYRSFQRLHTGNSLSTSSSLLALPVYIWRRVNSEHTRSWHRLINRPTQYTYIVCRSGFLSAPAVCH